MMGCEDAILSIVNSLDNKGNIGRTVIQKIMYFAKIKGVIEAEYIPHYYGPYSSDVFNSTKSLVSLNFLEEKIETTPRYPYTYVKYTYLSTEDGKSVIDEFIKKDKKDDYKTIKRIAETCEKQTNLDIDTLSCAAKVYYILDKNGKSMTRERIQSEAEKLDWELNSSQITDAVNLLSSLGLVKQDRTKTR